MQPPTCANVRIRSTQDAHKIFYAVQEGVLPMVTRRLDADERLALRSGCVYVWEERGPQGEITGLGIERFTEGRRWTPSRVRDEFLFYYEREPTPRSHDWDQLVKQTYSVWVDTEKGKRKWHLTAYFTDKTVNDLQTIDDLTPVKGLVVPAGLYQSTRVTKNRQKLEDQSSSGKTLSKMSTRTYAPFTYRYLADTSESLTMFDPYQGVSRNQYPPQTITDPSVPLVEGMPQHLAPHPRLPESQSLSNSSRRNYVAKPNLHPTGPSVPPSPLGMRSAAWGATSAVLTNAHPQAVPRGIPSRYDYIEPLSLPPVSSIYDGPRLPPVATTIHATPGRTISAHSSPFTTNLGLTREPSYELSSREGNSDADIRRENSTGPSDRELALAPIHTLERRHPYRRDPLDDKTLRRLPG